MTNPRLEPVRIIDRNGKANTVYRKPVTAVGAQSIPAPPVPPQATQRTLVEFNVPQWIVDAIAASAPEGSAEPTRHGAAMLSDEDAFGYLRFGVAVDWGAAMHAVHPDPAYWEHSEAGRCLADHISRWTEAPPVAKSVELMREQGYSPKDVERMLRNGLRDSVLRGVLTPAQTGTMYKRLHCVPAQFATEDNTAAMVRCLIDGTMPFELVERGECTQEALMTLADFAEQSRRDEAAGKKSSGFHAAAKEDPSLWSTMTQLLDDRRYRNAPAASRAWKALKSFGASDCLRFGVKRLLANTGGVLLVGEVIRQARSHGMSDDAIEAALDAHKDRPEAVLAIARGEAVHAVADGWL